MKNESSSKASTPSQRHLQSTSPLAGAENGPVQAARARHAVGDAAVAGPGTGDDASASSDWLAELKTPAAGSADGAPASGVPVNTGKADAATHGAKGRTVESKRGAH